MPIKIISCQLYNGIVSFFFEIDNFVWCFSTSFTHPNRSLITVHVFYHIIHTSICICMLFPFLEPLFYRHTLIADIVSIRTANSSKLWWRVIDLDVIKLWICQSKTTNLLFIWLAALLYFMFIHNLYIDVMRWMHDVCGYKSLLKHQFSIPFLIVFGIRR